MKPITETKQSPKHDAHCYDFARFQVESRGDDWNTFLSYVGSMATSDRLTHRADESVIKTNTEHRFFNLTPEAA